MRKNWVTTHFLAIKCHILIDFIRNGFQLASYSYSRTFSIIVLFIFNTYYKERIWNGVILMKCSKETGNWSCRFINSAGIRWQLASLAVAYTNLFKMICIPWHGHQRHLGDGHQQTYFGSTMAMFALFLDVYPYIFFPQVFPGFARVLENLESSQLMSFVFTDSYLSGPELCEPVSVFRRFGGSRGSDCFLTGTC